MATSYIGIFFEAFGAGNDVGDELAYALHIFFRGHSLHCVIPLYIKNFLGPLMPRYNLQDFWCIDFLLKIV